MMPLVRCRLAKSLRYVAWTLKFLGLVLLVTLVVRPVRNVLFMNVFPGNWLDHSSPFLLRMLLDSQNFDVDGIPVSPSPVNVPVDFKDIKEKFYEAKVWPEFMDEKRRLSSASKSDTEAQNRLAILSLFDPKMNPEERALSEFTMDAFHRACVEAGLTYFLVSGSLLGAVRHHGMIPWDYDYDVAMKASEWVRARDVLSNVKGFELHAPGVDQWKFYLKDRPQSKWPNIDIFFYNEDDTYMWSVTWGFKYGLVYLKSDVYPLCYRQFDHWNLPVPRAAHKILSKEFGPDYLSVCALTPTTRHRSRHSVGSVSCQTMYPILPFVFPHLGIRPGTVREELKVGDRSISNFTLPAAMSNLLI